MCFNEGVEDRFLRLVIGLGLLVVGIFTQNYIVIAVGAIAFATGALGFCALYSILKLNTGCKKD